MEYAQKLLSTRGGTLALAAGAALIAAIAVFVYVTNYRDSVTEGAEPTSALVATRYIPEGTPGEVVARTQAFRVDDVRESQLSEGALTDPAALRERTAVRDVYPGTLLTAADFTPTGAALSATLAPNERAITIPLDTARGIVNDIRVGDHVDVYVNHTIQCAGVEQATLRLLMANVPVVELRGDGESSRAASHFTLRVPAERAANLAFGSDEGILWFTLRPHGATKPSTDSFVTKETQTLKVTPGQALHACGGRR